MATIVDTASSHLEQVDRNIQKYFESSDQIAGLVKATSRVTTVSRYLYRFVAQQWRGGTFRKLVLSDGSLGTGSGPKLLSLSAGYYGSIRMYELTQEQVDTSKTTDQAVFNVLDRTIAEATVEAQVDDDIAFHGDGTGKLTNASSGSAAASLTFASATDYLGVNRLREGMYVDVWDSTGATKRGDGPYQIIDINYNTKTVTFGASVTGITTGDLLAFVGMDAYGPSTLVSFTSTWPGDGLTNNPGLTGDSFRHGIQYCNDNTTSNYYLGKLKSTVSQLLPAYVDAASSSVVFGHGLRVLDQMVQRRDKEIVNGLIGIFHMSQRSKVMDIGVTIANKFITGTSFGQSTDLMPSNIKYDDTFEFCGIKSHLSKRQLRNRIDFINPATWGRAQLFDTRFHTFGNGNRVMPKIGSDGTYQTAIQFGIEQAYDFVNFDPGAGGYIDNLIVPDGY